MPGAPPPLLRALVDGGDGARRPHQTAGSCEGGGGGRRGHGEGLTSSSRVPRIYFEKMNESHVQGSFTFLPSTLPSTSETDRAPTKSLM